MSALCLFFEGFFATMIAQMSLSTRPVGDGGKCRYPAEIGRLYFLECLVYIVC